MGKFSVTMPIAGSVTFEVECGSADDAVAAAWKKIEGCEVGEDPYVDLEWEYYDTIVEGNVCHASCNEVTVDEIKEGG